MLESPRRRRALLYGPLTVVAATVLMLGLAEVLSQLVLRVRYGWNQTGGVPTADSPHRGMVYDELLGWKPPPGVRLDSRHAKTFNAQGFRAKKEYSAAIPNGRYRIVCVGDSFTQGVGDDDETIPAQLEALSPTIEAVNMGRAAYGIDQMYLFYKRDGIQLETNLLLFAFIEDDFRRMTSDTFRATNSKPQLFARGNTLALANVPVPRSDVFPGNLGLYRIGRRAQERMFGRYDIFPVVELIFDDLKAMSRGRQQELVLVYLPSQMDSPGFDRPPRDIVRRVEQIAKDKDIPFWNLTSMFRGISRGDLPTYFVADGHYSARANSLAATVLLRALRTQYPDLTW